MPTITRRPRQMPAVGVMLRWRHQRSRAKRERMRESTCVIESDYERESVSDAARTQEIERP